jgi:hypothetical protein
MRRFALVAAVIVGALAYATTPAWAVSGAGYTTVNTAVDGNNHCKNGNPGVNCNIYDGKEFVWLNGGPAANGLGPDGRYFFAVLVPGGQPDPNDGGAKNLSDDYDAYTNRTFTVTNGEVSAYAGSHTFDSGSGGGAHPNGKPPFIRLFPYADTTNPGGVYIMAICSLGAGYPVVPKSCKYDAFKVRSAAKVQAVLSGAKYLDANHNGQRDSGEVGLAGWTIHIVGTDGINDTATTDANGDWTYTTKEHNASSGTTQYTVSEEQKSGWAQTGNTVDQSVTAGGSTVTLAGFKYSVTVPNDAVSAASNLLFGNVPPPVCVGPTFNQDGSVLTMVVQDPVGIASIDVIYHANANVDILGFSPGVTSPVTVTATRIDPSLNYGLTIVVTNSVGATVECDPVASVVGAGSTRVFRGLSHLENQVTLSNLSAVAQRVRVTVNGIRFTVRMRPGQVRTLDVSRAMHIGTQNVAKVKVLGRAGAKVAVAFSD